MDHLPRFRDLVGFRHDRVGESPNEFSRLQDLFSAAIPPDVREFLISLADCVLYYSFDAKSRAGKSKRYSHFVTTNIGPEFGAIHPFPTSLMGRVVRFRGMGLPDGYLPLMMDFGKTCWLWCDFSRGGSAVVVPKGTREFGAVEKEWTVIAANFDDFVREMRLDVSPHVSAFRVAGTGNVQPNMRDWLIATLGEDWDSKFQGLIHERRQRRSKPDNA